MKVTEQTLQQIERTIGKVADKFPTHVEATILTDIHFRVNPETGEFTAFDDDDREITRSVVEQWIGNTDEHFFENAARAIRKCLENRKETIEAMSILQPYSFVLEDEDKEPVEELYLVDNDTVIIDSDMMQDLDKDLDAFLEKLLKE